MRGTCVPNTGARAMSDYLKDHWRKLVKRVKGVLAAALCVVGVAGVGLGSGPALADPDQPPADPQVVDAAPVPVEPAPIEFPPPPPPVLLLLLPRLRIGSPRGSLPRMEPLGLFRPPRRQQLLLR